MEDSEKSCWILVSVLKENATNEDLERIVPAVKEMVDKWHQQGRIMWSGSFDEADTGMAVFEATKKEADEFYEKYRTACSDVLESSLHSWNAMPLLSLIES